MLKIIKISDNWKDIKNVSRTTVNKKHTDAEATAKFKEDMLISEHSPIRLLKVRFIMEGIKSWVATHFSRHTWECFISTSRSDRTGVDRSKLSQDHPVNLDGEVNAQHLIDTSRKRLCLQSSMETRTTWTLLKVRLKRRGEDALASVMVPNCVYRCGCPEVMQTKCNFFNKLFENTSKEDLVDIKKRYKIYSDYISKHYANIS